MRVGLDRSKRVVFINGGNRAGKTDLGAQWLVAHALGRLHPQVQQWADRNDLDVSGVQAGPGLVWAVALTFPDSRRYVRTKLTKYLPAGTRFRNWDAENEAEAILPNGGKIVCKAWTQTREGFQGDAIHALWTDEEPGDEPAWNEALMRLGDYDARALTTFTPGLKGLTWVYERYFKEHKGHIGYTEIWGEDNPHVPTEVLAQLLSEFGPAEQEARKYGRWVQREGRVYSAWRRDLHVIPARELPAEWSRWRAIDFGVRDPFACLWIAEDPRDKVYHIYRQLYRPGYTTRQNGDKINNLTGQEKILATVADSAGLDQRKTLALECKITTVPSPKDIIEGINTLSELLACDVEGRPHLLVHDCCTDVIREVENYVWSDKTKEVPEDDNNHTLDAIRYWALWRKRARRGGASA